MTFYELIPYLWGGGILVTCAVWLFFMVRMP